MTKATNKVLIAPSLLSADFLHLASELEAVRDADYLHYDVMDGNFVPNLSFGPMILKSVAEASDLPVDVHLMISNPDTMAASYAEAGAHIVSFHLEATNHANRVAESIRAAGAKPGIVINPATPVSALEDILPFVDLVLLMSVNPGFGGQHFIPEVTAKVKRLAKLCDELDVSPLIEVDGGVSEQNIGELVSAGANMFVAGSAVFGAADRAAAITAMRKAGEAAL